MFPQMRVNPFPEFGAFPEAEIMIDGAPGREVLRQVELLRQWFPEILLSLGAF
jgi:hypothetical protein